MSNDELFFINDDYQELRAGKDAFKSYQNIMLTHLTDKCCGYCGKKISTVPLGCPLRKLTKMDIENNSLYSIEYKNNNFHNQDVKYFFESEGIFGSLNCIKAFVRRQKSVRFNNSINLLNFIKREILNEPGKIQKPKNTENEEFCEGPLFIKFDHERICFITVN